MGCPSNANIDALVPAIVAVAAGAGPRSSILDSGGQGLVGQS